LLARIVSALAASASPSLAAESDLHASPAPAEIRWGAEVDVVQPFLPTIHIIRPRVTRTLWGEADGARGDLLVGVLIRPHIAHDIVETIDEYMLSVGYRQYLWRGFHVESQLNAGAAWGRNKFDGKDYTTPTLFAEVNTGYRFDVLDLGDGGSELYIAPQFGTFFSLGISDIGPRNGKPDWFLTGALQTGATF
jgi:hypothetical protein